MIFFFIFQIFITPISERSKPLYLMTGKKLSWQPFVFGGLASVTAEFGELDFFTIILYMTGQEKMGLLYINVSYETNLA